MEKFWNYNKENSKQAKNAVEKSLEEKIRDNIEIGVERTFVNANPAELRLFAQQLQAFADQMGNNMSRLQHDLNILNVSWRDQENVKFVEQFRQTYNPLMRLRIEMEDYSKFLYRKAQLLEDFLNRK